MVKLIKSVGTGMTREGIVSFDWDEPGDVEAQIDAAIETLNRSSFSLLSRRLAELATAILNQAGLPSDPGKFYEMTPEGGWVVVDEGRRPRRRDIRRLPASARRGGGKRLCARFA